MASPQVTPPTSSEPDWTDQVTGLVVDVVDSIRDKTTGPVLNAARGVVFGLIALFVIMIVAIIGLIMLGRALSLLPGPVWTLYLGLGVLFSVAGLAVMRMRFPK